MWAVQVALPKMVDIHGAPLAVEAKGTEHSQSHWACSLFKTSCHTHLKGISCTSPDRQRCFLLTQKDKWMSELGLITSSNPSRGYEQSHSSHTVKTFLLDGWFPGTCVLLGTEPRASCMLGKYLHWATSSAPLPFWGRMSRSFPGKPWACDWTLCLSFPHSWHWLQAQSRRHVVKDDIHLVSGVTQADFNTWMSLNFNSP